MYQAKPEMFSLLHPKGTFLDLLKLQIQIKMFANMRLSWNFLEVCLILCSRKERVQFWFSLGGLAESSPSIDIDE